MESRKCEQCGTRFVPRREHARFCSARCRVAWNREHTGGPPTEDSPLGWAISAMDEVTRRLAKLPPAPHPPALAVISEAVWWVTIVDATLVRYRPDDYDTAIASRPSPERELIEGTFGGFRFVRNQLGYQADPADFVRPGTGPVAGWHWRDVPRPEVLGLLPPRGQEWESSRHAAYQRWLAGGTVGGSFDRAAAFLKLAAS